MTTVVHPGDALSRRERLVYVIVLGALTAIGPFTIDLYLPAFPMLEEDLGVSAAAIQLTLTATTLGFAFGQLLVGPWSDKVGRRKPIIFATALHIVASLGAALAPDFTWLAIFRVLQGFGAAAGIVVATATVRDLFGGYPLVRMLSRLALVSGLGPIFAPVIGSQLLIFTDWRGVFIFLAAFGALVILGTTTLIVETLPPERRAEPGHSTVRQRYRSLFTDRIFVGIAIVASMNFAGLFSYLSSSPFLFQGVYDFNPQEYGLLFGINSVGVVLGVQVSARLQRFIGPQWVVAAATATQLIAAISIIVLNLSGAGLIGILIPLWFYILSCGFIFPAVQVIALVNHGKEAGTAASVLGAVNFGLAGLLSPIVGLFAITNAIPMGGVMAATVLVGMTSLWLIVRPRTVPALSR